MKKYVWLLFPLVYLSVCGLVWPPAPAQPKIKYLTAFTKASDLNINPSGRQKIFDLVFGSSRGEEGKLGRPQSVRAAGSRLIVADPSLNCVHLFDQGEKKYLRIERAGKEKLRSPVDAAIDNSGRLYVADSELKSIFVYSSAGQLLAEWGKGVLLRPTGLALNQLTQRLYVVDTVAGKVLIFDLAGKQVGEFGKPGIGQGEFNHPTYLALDSRGQVYVVDSLNFRVEIFSAAGEFKKSFGQAGEGPGSFSRPKGIALDSDDNIYVSDAGYDNVQIFNSEGKLLLFFGQSGNGEGEFWLPAGLAIDNEDRVYVADSYNKRIELFQYLK